MKKLVEAVHLLLHLKETKANKLEVMTLKVTTEHNILPRGNLFCFFFFFLLCNFTRREGQLDTDLNFGELE